jgi:two-component system, OmpR family, sensor histidine kinase MtrB
MCGSSLRAEATPVAVRTIPIVVARARLRPAVEGRHKTASAVVRARTKGDRHALRTRGRFQLSSCSDRDRSFFVMKGSAPTLRRSMFVLGGVLVSVALVAAAALVLVTTVLSHEMSRVAAEDARLRASLRTKVALLAYARACDWALSERSAAASEGRTQAESDLYAALRETWRLATPERVAELDDLMRKGEGYVATRERLEAKGVPLGTVIDQSTPALEAVFADLQERVASDDASVRAAEASAQEWHAAAIVLGVSAGALLLLGFAFAMIGANRLVQRPLLATTKAIARFADGDESARTVPSGARELCEMAATFNSLADRLARQESDRLTFLGGVAHDLRNPLSALKMATDVAQLGGQASSRERLEWALAIVARQIKLLDRMVGDLLDTTRIESGRLELRPAPLDVRPIVGHVVELYRPIASAHEIVFLEPTEAMVVECDPTRIEQVITNLVSNAVKYSPDGGRVTVSAFAERSEAVVAVADEGIGISPEDRERIFEPFRRTRRSRELVPGVGLGLSVARKIVTGHGGTLEVESRVGVGSTFRIRLPLVSARPIHGAEPDAPA